MQPLDPNSYFLQQGILGIIIVVLAGLIVWMQKRLDLKDTEIKALYNSINVIQDLRIKDNKEVITESIKFGTTTNNSLSAVQKSVDGIARVLELRKT